MSAFDEEESVIRDYPFLLMGCLRLLLENNSTNAAMFRECGGARCVQNIVPYSTSRTEALKIIRELILSGGNDDLGKEMFCIPLPPGNSSLAGYFASKILTLNTPFTLGIISDS